MWLAYEWYSITFRNLFGVMENMWFRKTGSACYVVKLWILLLLKQLFWAFIVCKLVCFCRWLNIDLKIFRHVWLIHDLNDIKWQLYDHKCKILTFSWQAMKILLLDMKMAHRVQLRIGKDYEAKCFWKKMEPHNTWHFLDPIA